MMRLLPRLTAALLSTLLVCLAPSILSAQVALMDNQGREWRQLVGTTSRTWNQWAASCPTDGITPVSGIVNGVDLDGWIWATDAQATELFSEFVPEITMQPVVEGAAYVLQALGFFSSFTPTFQYYTTFGGYNFGSGWTATSVGGMGVVASASAQYPVFYGSFSVGGLVDPTTSNSQRGAWFHRPTAFRNLQNGLTGTNGIPLLRGSGSLAPGSMVSLTVYGGVPGAEGIMVIGLTALHSPFLGGTLVPAPEALLSAGMLNGNQSLTMPITWPAGIPTGTQIFLQCWFADAQGVMGAAASNGLRIDAP